MLDTATRPIYRSRMPSCPAVIAKCDSLVGPRWAIEQEHKLCSQQISWSVRDLVPVEAPILQSIEGLHTEAYSLLPPSRPLTMADRQLKQGEFVGSLDCGTTCVYNPRFPRASPQL